MKTTISGLYTYPIYCRVLAILGIVSITFLPLDTMQVFARPLSRWAQVHRIPDFHHSTDSPYLVADQNRTVHAFSSQIVGGEGTSDAELAILYNQWSLEKGWSTPVDILLSPLYKEAQIMDAYLDVTGTAHVVFIGGNDVESKVYYARAAASQATQIRAWTEPILAGDDVLLPRNASFAINDQGKMVILYGGRWSGNGVYAVYSDDTGLTWSEPEPIFLTAGSTLLPFALHIVLGESGWLHAIWNIVDKNGQGRGIWYARARVEDMKWSEAIPLAETDEGLGTATPTIIEHGGAVFALFNLPPKISMRRSTDNGETWSEVSLLFPVHVGVNGVLSLVTDGDQDLHLFFGQRITGNPDIHGMWHSIWRAGSWSSPEPIISGPQVNDLVGDKAFDPYNARAIVSQGNVILVTWRNDPGNRGNGVWYSSSVIDAPEAPIVTLSVPTPTATTVPIIAEAPVQPTVTPTSEFEVTNPAAYHPGRSFLQSSPALSLLISVVPVLLFLALFITRSYYSYRR
jgi:hypothetical protein